MNIDKQNRISSEKLGLDQKLDRLDLFEKIPYLKLLDLIDEPNSSICKKLYFDHKEIMDRAWGSSVKHQAWEGGYIDHLEECMNIGIAVYDKMNSLRELPFSKSSLLLDLNLHDLEKAWKYGGEIKERVELSNYKNYQDFIADKISQYGFVLSDEEWNGIRYVHGEGDNYHPKKRIQGPLAAFVHICDVFSARIWFDYPKK